MNKKKALGLFVISPLSLMSVIQVVSCKEEEVVISTVDTEILKDVKLSLNSDGRNKTVDQFYDEGRGSGDWVSTLTTYTNWLEVVSSANTKGIELTFDQAIRNNNVIEIRIKVNGKPDVFKLYGFKSNSTVLNESVKNFALTVKQESSVKTSEEVIDEYNKISDPIKKDHKLISNFNIKGSEIILNNDNRLVWKDKQNNKDIFVEVESAEWNSNETDFNIKGTEVTINFKLTYHDPIKNKDYEAFKELKISGFYSYSKKFNDLVTKFRNSTLITAKENSSLGGIATSAILLSDFNNAATSEAKFDVLNTNTTIGTIPAFNKSSGLDYSATIKDDGLSIDPTNDTVMRLVCSFNWKGMTDENVELQITQFRSSNDYLNVINNALATVRFQPTAEGQKLSSIDIVNKFNEDPSSLGRYVDLSVLPSFADVEIRIVSAVANDDESISVHDKGTILDLVGQYTYNGTTNTVKFRTIEGFTSLFAIAEREFAKKVDSIQIRLADGIFAMPSHVNNHNWKNYFTGIPEENADYFISNLVLEPDDNIGSLGISFSYNYVFQGEVITKPSKYFRVTMLNPNEFASHNFLTLKQQMQNANFMDTIIRSDANKSSVFSSFFGSQGNKNSIAALGKIFAIPALYGVEFTLNGEMKYSKTDSSLGDTQLRIPVKIRNTRLSETFKTEFVVSGFKDPYGEHNEYIYGGNVRALINQRGNAAIKFNNPDHYEWKYVQEPYRHPNMGTWQDTWISYYWGLPFDYYHGGFENVNETKYLDGVRDKVMNVASSLSVSTPGLACEIYNLKMERSTYGSVIRLNKGQDGVCRSDVKVSMKFSTQLYDDLGNRADYNSVTIDNIYIFIYFRNGWWK